MSENPFEKVNIGVGEQHLMQADIFFEQLKNDPEKAIKWCESEIVEYKKLIKMIKNSRKLKKSKK